jgi:adenosylcobyric acid synthase
VAVRYVASASDLHRPDLLILPGTRTTVRALDWLRATGLAERIHTLAHGPDQPVIVGICGGYQLLGQRISDPACVESSEGECLGLGLLPVETIFAAGKLLRRVTVQGVHGLGLGQPAIGYEVHQGTTERFPGAEPWLRLTASNGASWLDGCADASGHVYGGYVHGLFDDERFLRVVIEHLRRRRGLVNLSESDWSAVRCERRERAARLGPWLERHCDLSAIAIALGLE